MVAKRYCRYRRDRSNQVDAGRIPTLPALTIHRIDHTNFAVIPIAEFLRGSGADFQAVSDESLLGKHQSGRPEHSDRMPGTKI